VARRPKAYRATPIQVPGLVDTWPVNRRDAGKGEKVR